MDKVSQTEAVITEKSKAVSSAYRRCLVEKSYQNPTVQEMENCSFFILLFNFMTVTLSGLTGL